MKQQLFSLMQNEQYSGSAQILMDLCFMKFPPKLLIRFNKYLFSQHISGSRVATIYRQSFWSSAGFWTLCCHYNTIVVKMFQTWSDPTFFEQRISRYRGISFSVFFFNIFLARYQMLADYNIYNLLTTTTDNAICDFVIWHTCNLILNCIIFMYT